MTNKIILFSEPTPGVMEKLKSEIFPEIIKNKVFAYMPSGGSDVAANANYTPFWQKYAQNNGARFVYLDNSKTGSEAESEIQKLDLANILMITGGNTFKLLKNLRDSGFDRAIENFWQKDNIVIAGFSAGALVLTPSVEIAKFCDPNEVNLTNLTGLGLTDFEVWPHFSVGQQTKLDTYINSKSGVVVKPIPDDQFLVVNR